ncbi:conserved hypothetical protein [Ricinus communis]|uniref:Uncharacterized protein n=1 Tax=Ricinus communis TaxID=3988 RepID=B9SZR3_RICCO|nr:conserved hypothetical protein [Ricinus communis]
MYVTRPLSLYRNCPSALSADPPEGPYTGYLVITDEEAEAHDTYCFGACKKKRVQKLPFPQDKILNVVHFSDYKETLVKKVWFLPVLDQSLSSNCYYVIKAKGRFKGQACTCSRDMDMGLCCFKKVINDIKPKPLDPRNIYQKFKIHRHHGRSFFAKSLAPYGHPPKLLRDKGWKVRISRSRSYKNKFQLSEALGLDATLRTQLPSFDFPISSKISPSVVVGTWYCPFVFIREEARIKEQMKKSMLYKMTLEQHWEEIYSWENGNNGSNIDLIVNANVQREMDFVFGMEAIKDDTMGHGFKS